jgi:hypothetical protein
VTAPIPAPPPADDPTTRHAAAILAAATSTAAALSGLKVLLAPFHVGAEAIEAALRISDRGTAHRPRPVGRTTRAAGALPRTVAHGELYFRAAYLLRAARRIQADLDAGASLSQAVRSEGRYWRAHQAARRARQQAAAKVVRAARFHGPILGWYLNPLLNNEAECIAANGHDFDARLGTVIGWPGTVHVGCGCYPGPPTGNGWVDDAVQGIPNHFQVSALKPLPGHPPAHPHTQGEKAS